MARISKNPEERKSELIEAAEQLFIEKGYGRTLVSDIVKKLGVAQGTFYYYIKSKDEVVEAILDRKWAEFAGEMVCRLNGEGLNAPEKLRRFFEYLLVPDFSGIDGRKYSVFLNPEILSSFHGQIDEARVRSLKPVIEGIIAEGVEAGLFGKLEHMSEITEIVFYGINSYLHIYSPMFRDQTILAEKVDAIGELIGKVLQIEKVSMKHIERSY